MQIKSASMLVTRDGYCVKIMLSEEAPILFFTDKEMNHRIWKATENNPDLLLDQREFWRMRKAWKLREVSLSKTQLQKAIETAQKVYKDPYYGLDETWRRKTKTTLYDIRRRNGNEVVVRYINNNSEPATLGGLPVFESLKQKFV